MSKSARIDAINLLKKIAFPVVNAALERRLKNSMPIEAQISVVDQRSQYSPLEAVGRLVCGMAPYIELAATYNSDYLITDISPENIRQVLDIVSNPKSEDFLNFSRGRQPLVDAAFLAQGLLRAPNALWGALDSHVKSNLLQAFDATRNIRPGFNNWLLFSAVIEVFFFKAGERWDKVRIDYALRQFEQWYLGDGHYGDGPNFHWNYYNSYVIQPMLLDVLTSVQGQQADWDRMLDKVLRRAGRCAVVLERLIGTDGSFPPIGRSLSYRSGAFHLLAQLAWQKRLPDSLSPAAVRCALMAVIEKTLGATGNFDLEGWLTIGLNGHQPAIGEPYISTGSLYLCVTAFLPLGLSEDDPFWSDPDVPWTQRRLWWLTDNIPPDEAIK